MPCSMCPITEGPERGSCSREGQEGPVPSFTRERLPPATKADSSSVLIMVCPWMSVGLTLAKPHFYERPYQPEKQKEFARWRFSQSPVE